MSIIGDAVRNLVLFVQSKKCEKHSWRSVTFSNAAGFATLLKLTLFHGCFPYFLNCTNGTESRKASHKTHCSHSCSKSNLINGSIYSTTVLLGPNLLLLLIFTRNYKKVNKFSFIQIWWKTKWCFAKFATICTFKKMWKVTKSNTSLMVVFLVF